MPDNEVSRRNFVKYAGAAAGAATLAGCSSGGGSSDGGNNSNGGSGGDSSADSGSRPVKWMGPAWSARDPQLEKYTEVTGNEIESTIASIPSTQQKILSGGASNFDAVSLETSGIGALQQNDAIDPIPKSELDQWNENSIAPLFRNPEERVGYLDDQVDTMNNYLWEDSEAKENLSFPPHVANFDSVGYNPKYVDPEGDTTSWSEIFKDKYKGKVAMDSISSIAVPEALMHLADNDMVDVSTSEMNNPTQDQIDASVDFLIKQKQQGQFRALWSAYGRSVNLMSSEEAIIGDIWQPACFDIRRTGTPCKYGTMPSSGQQGYRYWWGGISPVKPGASQRNNRAEVNSLLQDVHWSAWFPRYIHNWGYTTPNYVDTDLVRQGEDQTGEGMGAEYYDWAYEGKKTYQEIDKPNLFSPADYDWSWEEQSPPENGMERDCGTVDERIDRIGFFQIWPDNASYMQDRWKDFRSA